MATEKPRPCPSCRSAETRTIYAVRGIPVHSCILMATREEATSYPRRDLELACCAACGFVFNAVFDPTVHEYSARYEETQGFSPTFNAFARSLAAELVERHGLRGKDILEIGCGKGEFLVLLCELGENRGIGIDPAYVPERTTSPAAARIRWIRDLYDRRHADLEGDLVCCRHTLEHIAPTLDFMTEIRATLGARKDPVVFFELPDVLRVLREGAFWDIYYEHCSYFTTGSLARLFRATGFDVTALELAYAGQYILLTAAPAPGPTAPRLPLEDDAAAVADAAARFPDVVGAAIEGWRARVRAATAAGKRVVVWGSGSKGVAFLTTLGLGPQDGVELCVDVNPFKQGKFMPGTGQEVVAPERLRAHRPDLVIVMNPIYVPEIAGTLRELGVEAELVAV